MENLPFWDAERLRLNDLAFTTPSAEGMRLLRDRYGVRWLMADERPATASAGAAALGRVAALRFRSGDYAVYRLP